MGIQASHSRLAHNGPRRAPYAHQTRSPYPSALCAPDIHTWPLMRQEVGYRAKLLNYEVDRELRQGRHERVRKADPSRIV